MIKIAYFATGTLEDAAADLKRLRLGGEAVALRVIVPNGLAGQMEQRVSLPSGQVFGYSPFTALLLWIRLWIFLGLSSPAEIICLKSPRQFRLLKLLAL